ncbi:Putative uncharacterized protein [Escherichia coli D6-117.29]|nr:Protein of unknown function [Escherichia coli]CDP75069.1 Putative uncharacterized protein [Escherichia coli D6-117.29]CDU38414.1 Protein of unknown function [Escherichia coli]
MFLMALFTAACSGATF